MQASAAKKRILGFDGIRAIAVILVFLEHFVLFEKNLGGLGVRIFFVLSGFLIVGILNNQKKKVELGISNFRDEFLVFWEKRIKRIFPIYYLALLIVMAINFYQGKNLEDHGLAYYFAMMGNWYVQHVARAWGGPSHLWSVSVENHFYMFASPLLLLFPKRFHTSVLIATICLSVMIFWKDMMNWAAVNKPYLSSIINFMFMAMGGVIALNSEKLKRFKITNCLILFASIFAFIIINFYISKTGLSAENKMIFLYVVYMGIGVSLINYVSQNQESLFVKLLDFRPIRYLGIISYGFYVYQYFVPHMPAGLAYVPHIGSIWKIFQFVFNLSIAALSWELLEKSILQSKSIFKSTHSSKAFVTSDR